MRGRVHTAIAPAPRAATEARAPLVERFDVDPCSSSEICHRPPRCSARCAHQFVDGVTRAAAFGSAGSGPRRPPPGTSSPSEQHAAFRQGHRYLLPADFDRVRRVDRSIAAPAYRIRAPLAIRGPCRPRHRLAAHAPASAFGHQLAHRFHVGGLREHVERAPRPRSPPPQAGHVARQGRRVAAHVDDCARTSRPALGTSQSRCDGAPRRPWRGGFRMRHQQPASHGETSSTRAAIARRARRHIAAQCFAASASTSTAVTCTPLSARAG